MLKGDICEAALLKQACICLGLGKTLHASRPQLKVSTVCSRLSSILPVGNIREAELLSRHALAYL